MDLGDLLERLWVDYAAITPQAKAIHALLQARGEPIVNDHIALRTFADPRDRPRASWPPRSSPPVTARPASTASTTRSSTPATTSPRTPPCPSSSSASCASPTAASTFKQSSPTRSPSSRPTGAPSSPSAAPGPSPTPLVERLRRDSEYAAWLAAHGIRANHFTVQINALRTLPTLESMVAFLQSHHIPLNTAGGAIIKGSPAQLLEQCSTLADTVDVRVHRRAPRRPRLLLRVRPPPPRWRRQAVPRLYRGLRGQDLREHRRPLIRSRTSKF
jgi:hypothetical protein